MSNGPVDVDEALQGDKNNVIVTALGDQKQNKQNQATNWNSWDPNSNAGWSQGGTGNAQVKTGWSQVGTGNAPVKPGWSQSGTGNAQVKNVNPWIQNNNQEKVVNTYNWGQDNNQVTGRVLQSVKLLVKLIG